MTFTEGFPTAAVVVFAVLWLLWLPVVVVVALVQKRTIGLAILWEWCWARSGSICLHGCRPHAENTGWYAYWYVHSVRSTQR